MSRTLIATMKSPIPNANPSRYKSMKEAFVCRLELSVRMIASTHKARNRNAMISLNIKGGFFCG